MGTLAPPRRPLLRGPEGRSFTWIFTRFKMATNSPPVRCECAHCSLTEVAGSEQFIFTSSHLLIVPMEQASNLARCTHVQPLGNPGQGRRCHPVQSVPPCPQPTAGSQVLAKYQTRPSQCLAWRCLVPVQALRGLPGAQERGQTEQVSVPTIDTIPLLAPHGQLANCRTFRNPAPFHGIRQGTTWRLCRR